MINDIKGSCKQDGDSLSTTEVTAVPTSNFPFCASGDSGSIVMDLSGNAMGLLHTSAEIFGT